MKALNKCLYK